VESELKGGSGRSDPEQSGPLRIALCLDAEYAPWAATTIASCLQSNPGNEVAFHIVHESSLSDDDMSGLQAVVDHGGSTVEFHSVNPSSALAALPSNREFGTVVWLRLFLPEILTDVPRILYLDADTFVGGPLAELQRMSLGDAPLAAVANVVEPPLRPHVAALGVDYPGGFFNSGVLLLNLALMRAERSVDQLLRFAQEHREELVWPDQDALNVVFAGRWLALHPRFNAQTCLWGWREWAVEVFGADAVRAATESPVIRHFEGRGLCKPWHYMCPAPGYKEYRRALASTPWAGTPIEDRTPATRVLRLLPAPLQLRAYRRLEHWRTARGQRTASRMQPDGPNITRGGRD
jgi:lipopolysaccharide biosynthesis glycosyltransferase